MYKRQDEEKGEGYVTFTEGLESIQMIQMPQTTQMVQTTQMTQTTQTPQTTLAVKSNGLETEITVDDIHRMMRENLVPTRLFEETGGVHMVSLYNISDGTRLLKKEDAARHNAVDKVIGAALRQQVCFGDTALVLSGRVSLEILRKAETAGIRVVLSKAAPTDQSVEAADEAGITLIGFIREGRMNIYTHPQRVSLPDKLYAQIARERRAETVRKSRYL